MKSARKTPFAVLLLLAAFHTPARADLSPGNCPPHDLLVNLNTGWDQAAEAVLVSAPVADDDWRVIVDAAAGPVPRPADVRDPVSAWLTLPESKWIAGTVPVGPLGVTVYEYCWCMDDDFTSPLLQFAIRADDQAIVRLNGFNVLSLPTGTFNDAIATGISVIDPSKFLVGLNCLTVHVDQQHLYTPHGFDLKGSVTATDGRCCGCYDLPPDAEAWWPLDETAGSTATDIVNGHDGSYVGAAPVPAPGYVDGALLFDGINDYVAVPDHPGLDFDAADDLTIDAWILTNTGVREPIVNKRDIPLNDAGYAFLVGGGVLTFEMADGATTVTCNGGSGLNDGFWHFVAVTLDHGSSTGIRLYVDGAPLPATCDPTPVGSLVNARSLSIGARPAVASGAMWWRGRLDEIEIFRRALTDTEIAELYAADAAGKCPPPQPLPPCETSEYPACGGACPPGLVCVPTPNQSCACDVIPCGAPGNYPACGGACPQGLECAPDYGGESCECVDPFPACGDTTYPQCNGTCPQGQKCENVFGTDDCACAQEPAPCGDPQYPACGGACPADQKCVARTVPAPGCQCESCAALGASGLDEVLVGWAAGLAKDDLRWSGAGQCALVYNDYRSTGSRLPDQDGNGLADSYGTCFANDVIGSGVRDPSRPPPGEVHWYLVTAEGATVEGSLGANGAGLERPNVQPCP